ncbi:MAG: hypothetical protein HC904_02195 [Blastochloris sp.]|nr:hypothetical protein [Blastochloris sp.]
MSILKKLGLLLSWCALSYVSGAHLAVVQSLAWTQMLVEYTSESGLARGISQTFDGEHPCGMCKEVEKARNDQAPQQVVLKLSELKAATPFVVNSRTIRYSSEMPAYFSSIILSLGISQPAPPHQPPRA